MQRVKLYRKLTWMSRKCQHGERLKKGENEKCYTFTENYKVMTEATQQLLYLISSWNDDDNDNNDRS